MGRQAVFRTMVMLCVFAGATSAFAQAEDEHEATTEPEESSAEEEADVLTWERVGYGRLITNDFLGDGRDRLQTGSYVSSRIYSRNGLEGRPDRIGELLEFRLQADIKAPENLRQPAAGDRPYAGSLTFGAHTHFTQDGFDLSMGAELVVTGPITQLDEFQTALHDGLGIAPPSTGLVNAQIGNGVHPGAVVEIGRRYEFSENVSVRPFMEGRIGAETLVRAGFDVDIGWRGSDALLIREGISGQFYRVTEGEQENLSFSFGADTAYVEDSIYLPASRGLTLTDARTRARVGVSWDKEKSFGFLGVTYLSKEFETQTDTQLVGSIRLAVRF